MNLARQDVQTVAANTGFPENAVEKALRPVCQNSYSLAGQSLGPRFLGECPDQSWLKSTIWNTGVSL